jgi:signal transduction histidine kinase
MGMGLSIFRSIIEANDGRLWASAGVDCGAVINIQLPALGS